MEPESGVSARGFRLSSFISRTLFPERQIYVRSGGRSRHFVLTPLAQLSGAVALAALLGAGAYAGYEALAASGERAGMAARLEAQRAAFEVRLAAAEEARRALAAALEETRGEQDAARAALARGEAERAALAERLAATERDLAATHGRIARLDAALALAGERLAAREGHIAALEEALAAGAARTADLEAAFGELTAEMTGALDQRDAAERELAALRVERDRLLAEVGDRAARHEALLARLEEITRSSLASLGELFARSNLDIDRVLEEAQRDYTGQGGPYVPLEDGMAADAGAATGNVEPVSFSRGGSLDEREAGGDADLRVAALMDDLGTLDLMRFAAERLPFGAPVTGARLTSDFGPRRDPHNGKKEMHEGIDFAGPRGTPILATGDGVVVFSGRQRGYGIVVKIRHAFGFETVYAHLSRTRVKRGQQVKRGDRIGDMGSTGRSTGTHVHYEVRINGKPVNPRKFIEAARDVL